ncbi:uncharacterized protein LOC143901328 isoform X2 [Temnothorax americanus]|uniref:uncharacterized protein LOC143901328 isoform X2 n=1 Tax=Temnothorax americanus TaxID=1964332 RepID=UPI004068DC10
MENNSNESRKPCETVTLIFKEERFEVEKKKLIDKSQYFAALLSANYLEYGQTDHVINYDVSLILLQDFIDWIHHDKITFTSATSYGFEELDRLLILLELSVLFAADKLIEDITDRLERYYMSPQYAIDIWLLAQELNINVLKDLSLAFCLDHFDELPLDSIYELSKEHFMKLIGNINVRATVSHLLDITRKWMNHRHGVISCEYKNGKQYIHCWDGNDFFELTSFEYPADIVEHCCITGRPLEGMQITANRYNLYLCGGEYGIGSGKFNKNVWRYHLISKKWILETVMPVKRRHMITVFLKDKLYLVGGVGRYRQKLQTIDIYDIYTGMWTSSRALISLQFTSVPEHFIFNDKLIIHQYLPTYYIYFPDVDEWETKIWRNFIPPDKPILTLNPMSCYIDFVDQDEMVLKAIAETCNVKGCNDIIKTFSNITHIRKEKRDIYKEHKLHYSLPVKCDEFSIVLTPFFHDYRKPPAVLLCTSGFEKDDLRKDDLHLHNIPIQEPRKFRSLFLTKKNSYRRFFNLFHPAHLHTTNLDDI